MMARISQKALKRCAATCSSTCRSLLAPVLRQPPRRRADEPPDQRHRRHQPGRLAECGRHWSPACSRWSASWSPCSCSTSGWRWPRCWWCRSCSGSPTSWPATRARASASCRSTWASSTASWKKPSAGSGWSRPSGATRRSSRPSASTTRRSSGPRVYANTYALLLMPLTNVLGNFFVIVLAGLGGWLALQGSGHGGHHRHLHQLWAQLHQPAAPAGQHVQRHPGRPGRRRARL